MRDLGLSKGLLDSVTGILKDSSKLQAEQNKASHEKMAAKFSMPQPLSMQDAKVDAYAAKAADRRILDTISSLYSSSVAENNARAKEESEAIRKAYAARGGVQPVTEAKKLSPKQKEIAAVAGDKSKIDAMDFKVLRDRKKAQTDMTSEEAEQIEEKDIGKHNNATTGFKALVKKLSPKYGAAAAAKIAGAEKKKVMAKEEKDTPGNSYGHQCAIHVKHASLGEGKTLFSQHAQPDQDGYISWYTVMFESGLVDVETKDLEILESEWHNKHPYSKSSKKMGIKPKKD